MNLILSMSLFHVHPKVVSIDGKMKNNYVSDVEHRTSFDAYEKLDLILIHMINIAGAESLAEAIAVFSSYDSIHPYISVFLCVTGM